MKDLDPTEVLDTLAQVNASLLQTQSDMDTKFPNRPGHYLTPTTLAARQAFDAEHIEPLRKRQRTLMDILQFYPTPPDITLELLAPFMQIGTNGLHKLPAGWNIIDPTCGHGDMLATISDHAQDMEDRYRTKLFGVEIATENAAVARSRVNRSAIIHADIRHWKPDQHFNLWVMNPPFRNGAELLLRVWEIAGAGAQIACILNAENLVAPKTAKQQELLTLIRTLSETNQARVVGAGKPFKHALRTTDAECVYVYLSKPEGKTTANWEAVDFEQAEPTTPAQNQTVTGTELIRSVAHGRPDAAAAIVAAHERCLAITAERDRLWHELTKIYRAIGLSGNPTTGEETTAAFWNYIFDATQVGRRATSKFRQEFDEQRAKQQAMAFSQANITELLLTFLNYEQDYIDQAIKNAFLEIIGLDTSNASPDRRWVTNKGNRLNAKMIVPWWSLWDNGGNTWRTYYDREKPEKLDDLDKAIAALEAIPYDQIVPISRAIDLQIEYLNNHRQIDHRTVRCRSTFFTVQFFKRGTIHLWWRDLDMLDRFNLAAARAFRWLGDQKHDPYNTKAEAAARAKERAEWKREMDWVTPTLKLDRLLATNQQGDLYQ